MGRAAVTIAAIGALIGAGCGRAAQPAASSSSATPGAVQPENLVQPGAPGQPTASLPADTKSTLQESFIPADVQFMQGMIHHHAQALQMTAMLYKNTGNPTMITFAHKIDNSQGAEIKWMSTWLKDRGQTVPMIMNGMVMMNGGDMPMMPGMLTPQQMQELGAAHGRAFDKLFLIDMIQHHEGALSMVRDLEKTPGGASSPPVYTYITNVDVDQRTDIDRMHALLKEMQ